MHHLSAITSDTDSESDSSDTSSVSSDSTVLSFEAPSITSLSSSSSESSDNDDDGISTDKPPLHHSSSYNSESKTTSSSNARTYRFNGDNMDYTEIPRHQRSDVGKKSQHYFQSYAVKDRIDFSHLSSKPLDVSKISREQLSLSMLPSSQDDEAIRRNMIVLVARVLCDNIPFFNTPMTVLLIGI